MQPTRFSSLPDNQWPQWAPGNLTLFHDGTGWNGTFIHTARFMLTNALSDGAPLNDATVVDWTDEGDTRAATGTVTAVNDRGIHFEDGHVIPWSEDVLAVSF